MREGRNAIAAREAREAGSGAGTPARRAPSRIRPPARLSSGEDGTPGRPRHALRLVAAALAEGAQIACGGQRPATQPRGYYYEPTLLTGVSPTDAIAQREVFGPVTAVLPYDDVDEAIAIANGTEYGLAASVYSANRERALAVARRIRAGSVALNTFGPTMAAPFGGVKRSGWGRECGPEGILEFTSTKQVLLG